MSRRTRLIPLVAIVACVASCTRAAPSTPGSSAAQRPATTGSHASALVNANDQTTLSAGGVVVTLPAGSAQNGVTATFEVAPDAAPGGLPAGIRVLGPRVSVELPGGLSKPATLTFPVPAEVAAGTTQPVVVWQDGQGGWRWVPTTWPKDAQSITATVDHFSSGFLAGIDTEKLKQDAVEKFTNYITGVSGVTQPKCGDEAAIRNLGVQVTSDSGDKVKWCLGLEKGRQVLKVANNRRTFLQVNYPIGWQIADTPPLSFSPEAAARAIGSKVALPKGTTARIIDGGDTLTLTLPDGARGRVSVETSLIAWAISGIGFGLETFFAVYKAAMNPLGKIAKSRDDYLALLLGASDKAEVSPKECLLPGSELTEMNETEAWKVLEFGFKCGAAIMKSQLDDLPVFGAGVLLSMVGAAVSFVLTGVHLVVTGARNMYDEIVGDGGGGHSSYDIVIKRPGAALTIDYDAEFWVSDGAERVAACRITTNGATCLDHAGYIRPETSRCPSGSELVGAALDGTRSGWWCHAGIIEAALIQGVVGTPATRWHAAGAPTLRGTWGEDAGDKAVLPSGYSLNRGSIVCAVAGTSVRCYNTKSGVWFLLASAGLTTDGRVSLGLVTTGS